MGHLTSRATIDGAAPSVVDTSTLGWNTNDAIQPSSRLTLVDDLAKLQQGLTLATIAFGVGGAFLATLFLDWIRGREVLATSQNATSSPTGHQLAARSTKSNRARVVVGIAVLFYALGRLRR
jgi:hypothetical protein